LQKQAKAIKNKQTLENLAKASKTQQKQQKQANTCLRCPKPAIYFQRLGSVSKTKQNQAKTQKHKPTQSKASKSKQNQTKPSKTKQNQTQPSKTKQKPNKIKQHHRSGYIYIYCPLGASLCLFRHSFCCCSSPVLNFVC
jgi:cytochrome c biogenesis protein ResB